MDKKQAEYLMNHCTVFDTCNEPEMIETHISWILLTDNFAFKIKRPVKFSFLDFSTAAKRKFYCNQEVKLNRRLAPEMYLDVVPVTRQMLGEGVGEKESPEVDYMVRMKRMDGNLQMDKMLERGEVTADHIDILAGKIARFHKKVRALKNAFATLKFQERYADLQSVSNFLAKEEGGEWENKVNTCVGKSYEYLNSIRNLSNHRVISGFQRNCHGDLNASNIFLYDDPVIYDCIEFNSDYRRIDVLNDIAFLCVDLEFAGRLDLSERFYRKYLAFYETKEDPQTNRLFNYYKSYRAGIRAKVTLINLQNSEDEHQNRRLEDVKKYILMMEEYLKDF